MDRGLFIAASGMLANQHNLDIVSNNLSNTETTGFKADEAQRQNFGDLLMSNMATGQQVGPMSMGTEIAAGQVNQAQGDLTQTGRNLDFAIQGNGYFAVQEPNGRIQYTRDGSFSRDSQGELVTADGYKVLGRNGQPIRLGTGDITLSPTGTIVSSGRNLGQFAVAQLQNVTKAGNNLFNGTPTGQANGAVVQGSLEQSNVDMTQQVTSMMQTLRTYETSQRVLTAIDQSLQKAANDVGRTY